MTPDQLEHAACRNEPTDTFYPEQGQSAGPAKLICHTCPIKTACLVDGINEHDGIWGGTTYRQRRTLKRVTA